MGCEGGRGVVGEVSGQAAKLRIAVSGMIVIYLDPTYLENHSELLVVMLYFTQCDKSLIPVEKVCWLG